jgi:hypothetical protein
MSTNMAQQGFLSMSVQQAAAAQQLGAFHKTYTFRLIGPIIGIPVYVVVGVLFAFFFPRMGIVTSSSSIVFPGIALLFLCAAVYQVYLLIQHSGRKFHLFQQGLVIEDKNQVQPFPWSQTAEVWRTVVRNYRNGIYVGTTYSYTLRRVDGYQVRLNNLVKNIGELGEAVSRGVTRELVPRALYSIRGGQTLTFGQFTINQQGMGNGREFIAWPEVQAINVNRGVLTVKKAGKFFNWGSSMVAKIPNFFVFLAVAEEMIRQAAVSGGRQGY